MATHANLHTPSMHTCASSTDPDEVRIPSQRSGCASDSSAHLTWRRILLCFTLSGISDKVPSTPCCFCPHHYVSFALKKRRACKLQQLLRACYFSTEDWDFFFQEWKEKAHSVGSHKSAAENKVMHFTAHDPNTCGAKLAFSHSNWHKMCLGWHFTFTICPSGKIKAVPFSFLGISLSLNSSLNACLCVIIFLRHCFKSSLSPSASPAKQPCVSAELGD